MANKDITNTQLAGLQAAKVITKDNINEFLQVTTNGAHVIKDIVIKAQADTTLGTVLKAFEGAQSGILVKTLENQIVHGGVTLTSAIYC